MGLDMYLTKKIYVGAEHKHRNVNGEVSITVNGKPLKVNFYKIVNIEERFGYWWEANAIHGWLVNNVQDGVDNCAEYCVSEGQLSELLSICKQIKDNPTPENCEDLLPAQFGFFFGDAKYDQNYFNKIDETINILEEALQEEEGDFYYQSSW